MIDQSVDIPDGPGVIAGLPEAGQVSSRRSTAFCYCGECGSWDAHGIECLCCGYDFRAQPPAKVQPID